MPINLNKPKNWYNDLKKLASCRATSTDIPGPLSPLLPIVHRLWRVFKATTRILTQLLYVCSSWSFSFERPYVGVHRSTSLMSSSLLLQQCPALLVRLTWIVFVMGGRWPYSWCFVGRCLQDRLCPIGWGCRIHRLLLRRGVRLPHQWVSCIWHETIWWWGSSNAGALGNTEYPFIAIARRSTLTRSGSTW